MITTVSKMSLERKLNKKMCSFHLNFKAETYLMLISIWLKDIMIY